MGRLAHLSKVKIHKEPGNSKIKRTEIEGFPGVTRMGVHGGIAEFFKVVPDEPLPSTLDYVVAAVGGCLTGTIAGALEGHYAHLLCQEAPVCAVQALCGVERGIDTARAGRLPGRFRLSLCRRVSRQALG